MSENLNRIVIFGAGSIGRGFLGQIFARSGWQVTFIDANESLVETLQQNREYCVTFLSPDASRERIVVPGINAVSVRDTDAVADSLRQCRIIGTSVGGRVLPHVARTIADCIDSHSLNHYDVILAENIHDADEPFTQHLKSGIRKGQFGQPGVHLCSVGKMVPVSANKPGNADLSTEAMNKLIVDGRDWRNPIPAIPWLYAVDSIGAYMDRKLYIHNLAHVSFAFLSIEYDGNYQYIWELMGIPPLRNRVSRLMKGVIRALAAEHPDEFTESSLTQHLDNLFNRFCNRSLQDTIDRVGRDVARKLGNDDRIVGAMKLASAHGQSMDHLAQVYTAALRFAAMREEKVAGAVPHLAEGRILDLDSLIDEINGASLDTEIRQAILRANLGIRG